MSDNIVLSQFEGGLSVQSCFPDVRSVTNSFGKSYHEDDDNISIECFDTYYASCSTVQPKVISRCPTFSTDNISIECFDADYVSCSTAPPRDITSQSIPSSVNFAKVKGSDDHVVLNPSLWPARPTAAEQTAKVADDSVNLQRPTLAYWRPVFEETRRNCFTSFVSLHLAALKGDWDFAKEFLARNPRAVSARITHNFETALHIAAGARHTMFVQELVKLMTPDDLALQNKVGNTALCFAAASGIKKIAEVMVNKNNKLPSIRGSKGATALCMAALLGHKDMVWYLYTVTKEEDLTDKDRIELLVASITADLFDVALQIIQSHPELAVARDGNGETALHVLAQKPSAFPSGSQLAIWQRCMYSWTPVLEVILWSVPTYLGMYQLYNITKFSPQSIFDPTVNAVPGIRTILETKLMHIQAVELVRRLWGQFLLLDDSKIGELLRSPSRLLFTAAAMGNVEFLTVLIRMYPNLIWKVDEHSRSIFHIAVVHRQEKILNLINEIGAHKDLIAAYKDENNNNMLHLAGKLAPANQLKRDSGAALQLRREFHWFKEVEKIVQPSYREMKNSEGKTPYILFSEEHKGLVQEGEKWMKDTASSCMVVATLIATVMFAAAFTVPGGNNNDTGRPIFLNHRPFMVFAISNALALFSSATSILMFLSILTSRYADEDFLHSLPNRLIIGLATLFISIATMMIAFAATLFIVLGHGFAWIAIPIATVACVPVTMFALLQFPLLADMISHIYCPLFRRGNHLY